MPREERLHSVSFAARPAVVLRYLGQLLLAVGLLMLVPAAVALGFGQLAAAGTLAAAAVTGIALAAALRRIPAPEAIQTNEAMVVSALGCPEFHGGRKPSSSSPAPPPEQTTPTP